VANALTVFLTSESHVTLNQVDVDYSFYHLGVGNWGAICFLATRHDGLWDVKVTINSTSESSITAQFEDVLAKYQ
jgi:hypothetical protein